MAFNPTVFSDLKATGDLEVVGATTLTGAVSMASMGTPVLAAEHGAGAVGTSTFGAPKTRRWTENGVIITQTTIDITGLGCKGTAANDVIGLPAGGVAFIGRNVVASNGIIFKAELSCIEAPAGTGSATVDIDVATNSSGTLVYDDAGGTAKLINGGSLAAGQTVANLVPALTANHYFYLVEADTAATDGVYTAGQYVLTTYGHALLA